MKALADEVAGTIGTALNPDVPRVQRKARAKALLARTTGACVGKYFMKAEPWAEEIALGLSVATLGFLMLEEKLDQMISNLTPQPQQQPGQRQPHETTSQQRQIRREIEGEGQLSG